MIAIALLLSQAAPDGVTLTVAGAIIMTLSVGLVLVLNVFCLARILREPEPQEHHHVPLEIDVGDDEQQRVRCPNQTCRTLNDPHAEYCSRCGTRLPHDNV